MIKISLYFIKIVRTKYKSLIFKEKILNELLLFFKKNRYKIHSIHSSIDQSENYYAEV